MKEDASLKFKTYCTLRSQDSNKKRILLPISSSTPLLFSVFPQKSPFLTWKQKWISQLNNVRTVSVMAQVVSWCTSVWWVDVIVCVVLAVHHSAAALHRDDANGAYGRLNVHLYSFQSQQASKPPSSASSGGSSVLQPIYTPSGDHGQFQQPSWYIVIIPVLSYCPQGWIRANREVEIYPIKWRGCRIRLKGFARVLENIPANEGELTKINILK